MYKCINKCKWIDVWEKLQMNEYMSVYNLYIIHGLKDIRMNLSKNE